MITHLELTGCDIGDKGCVAVADAVVQNRALTALDLGQNQIGAAGAKALSDALRQGCSLTELDLYTNVVGDSGAAALACALPFSHSLASLNLCRNRLCDAGALALAEALKSVDSQCPLIHLALGYNRITDHGAQSWVLCIVSHLHLWFCCRCQKPRRAIHAHDTVVVVTQVRKCFTIRKAWCVAFTGVVAFRERDRSSWRRCSAAGGTAWLHRNGNRAR